MRRRRDVGRTDYSRALGQEPARAAAGGQASPSIGSLAVDPGDGTLIIGTGLGLYRLPPGGERAEKYTGRLRMPRGSGLIASNLVLRFTGPGELVASGHPQRRSALPENLGLVRSTDGGRNWSAVSQLGRLDFHALDARGSNIVGVPAESTTVLSSNDGGRTFEHGTATAPPVDLDVDPRQPERVVLATSERIFVSADSGAARSFGSENRV